MPTNHPIKQPFDHVNMVCPVNGELRYGASLARVQLIRERFAQIIADQPDIEPGSEFYDTFESPTCGTVTAWCKVGVNDPIDGLPAIWRVDNHNVVVPTIGHRHIRRGIFDQLNIGTAPTDVLNFGVEVQASRQMHFDLWLPMVSSANSIAASLSCNGPATSMLLYEVVEWTSASVELKRGATTYDAFGAHMTGNGATPRAYRMKGTVVFAADGVWIPRVRAELGSGGTCSVQRGGFLEFDLV